MFRNLIKQFSAFILDILETIVIALAFFVFMYLFLFQPHQVNGICMEPLLLNHQHLLTDKLSYRFHEPQRGETIVFKYPQAPQYEYIKRIIGLPGEYIEIEYSKVTIYNEEYPEGLVLNEPYLKKGVLTEGGKAVPEGKKVFIASEKYVVFGDNREQSSDSREWGMVPRQNIIGRAWLRYWPPQALSFIARAEYKQ